MASKAKSLKKLLDAGFNVPKLIEVTSSGITEQKLLELVDEKLYEANLFAVRSSAEVEDGEDKSYAGHFYSAVAVEKSKLYEEYVNVVASYNGQKGNVIVQRFIPSDAAGVLFTNEGSGLMVINSNLGLCKTVVEGQACDEYYITRDAKVLRKHISDVKTPLLYRDGALVQDKSARESLTQLQIEKLVTVGLQIEIFFGKPQDIEWCFMGDDLYILQSRPITRYTSKNNWVFYDSANIAESYSGVVLPLTHSFAASIYKKVYENLLIASGASRRRIARNQQIFSNMVSNFYGRMYYNMNNWYLMMSFMPGYQRNKGNLESMLTMNIRVDVLRSVLPSIWLKIGYPFIVIYKLLIFNKVIRSFKQKVTSTLKHYRAKNIENYHGQQCVDLYNHLTRELLEDFHIPVENDFLMMTYLGILRKKYSEDDLKPMIAFDNVSSKQVESITKLAKSIFAKPELAEAIERKNGELFKNNLQNYPEVKTLFDKYFNLYGGRFANELKLESADVEFEPEALFNLLKAYRNYSPKTIEKKGKQKKGFVLRKFIKYAQQREELRLLRSNAFSLVRRIYRRIGTLLCEQGIIDQPADVFYLTIDEATMAVIGKLPSNLKLLVSQRREEYEKYRTVTPPTFFTITEGGQPIIEQMNFSDSKALFGRSCTAGIVKGRIRVFNEFSLPEIIDFDIMVARNTDPGWAALIGLSKGIIVENGGILSHAAIVSRELGIPTVIGVANVTQILKTGQVVEINGGTGEVKIIQ
jgi:rifampicin phosphotransferase